MKIYVVIHFYDNGESYEDCRDYTDYYVFSTEAKAYGFYCNQILSDYEGKYSMYEKELDTQKQTLLEESPWVECRPMYQYDSCLEDYEPEADSIDYDDGCIKAVPDSIQNELKAEEEWLTTKREQCELLEEIEEDRLNAELAESEKVWESITLNK